MTEKVPVTIRWEYNSWALVVSLAKEWNISQNATTNLIMTHALTELWILADGKTLVRVYPHDDPETQGMSAGTYTGNVPLGTPGRATCLREAHIIQFLRDLMGPMKIAHIAAEVEKLHG